MVNLGGRLIVAAVLCVACQGQGTPVQGSASSATGSGDASGPGAPGPADAGVAVVEPGARDTPDEPLASDPRRAIAELGAIPAWQAVVDRAQLLGRRGQHGVVYGRVGPALLMPGPTPPAPATATAGTASAGSGAPPAPAVTTSPAPPAPRDAGLVTSPYVWLIDDTEGNGTLGIRIALGERAKEGDRIAAGGAWQLDVERRWYWRPDTVQQLPPAPPSDLEEPPPPAPSHEIATSALPPGARTASIARDNDVVYFQVVGPPPASDGDGWQIADQLGSSTALVMNLPGERPSYGGQDMRSADERWLLRPGQTYWVRIGKLHKRNPDKSALVNARTAPVRVP
jgi:hypothetical protein